MFVCTLPIEEYLYTLYHTYHLLIMCDQGFSRCFFFIIFDFFFFKSLAPCVCGLSESGCRSLFPVPKWYQQRRGLSSAQAASEIMAIVSHGILGVQPASPTHWMISFQWPTPFVQSSWRESIIHSTFSIWGPCQSLIPRWGQSTLPNVVWHWSISYDLATMDVHVLKPIHFLQGLCDAPTFNIGSL